MDINREEIQDSCEQKEEDSTSNKLSVSTCWERSVGFVTAAHAHPKGLFIHPQSWLALYFTFMHTNAYIYAHKSAHTDTVYIHVTFSRD